MIELYPAVDILDGKAVRLTQGDFQESKVYDEDPCAAAEAWVSAGARALHVVDLDGAREGSPRNLAHLGKIADAVDVPVQYGGGLRTIAAIEQAFDAGAEKAILGTAAVAEPAMLREALGRWPGKVLVSIDARGGKVSTAGWTQTLASDAVDLARSLVAAGASSLVCTDVDKDGMLEGPSLHRVRELCSAVEAAARDRGTVEASLICSGGVGTLAHLQALQDLHQPALRGVIVGKALYERRFTIQQALAVLDA